MAQEQKGLPRSEQAGHDRTWRFSAAASVSAAEVALILSGRLGHAAVPALEAALQRLPPSLGEGAVVLDFAGVDYVSSAGLRLIDSLGRRLENGGRRLKVRHLADPVRLVMELSGLIERVEVEPTTPPAGTG